jgi:hypothetical protein
MWRRSRILFPLYVGVCLGAPLAAAADPTSAAAGSTESDAASRTGSPGLEVAGLGDMMVNHAAVPPSSPMRVTLAQELSYKVARPEHAMKNRLSGQMEYSRYFLEHFSLQLNAKEIVFMYGDHRHEAEGHDTAISQAYLQASFAETSIKAGIQTLPWGESILAPITDEVSPRDNREMFNFNLEELRIGQPMITLDQFVGSQRWTFFVVTDHYYNRNPVKGTAYYFDPFTYRSVTEGDNHNFEAGVSWKKSFASSDITFMAANLIANDYAVYIDTLTLLRAIQTGDQNPPVTRVREPYFLAGMSFSHAFNKFVIRGESALKSPKAYNQAALQIVKRDEIDSYVALEYARSSSLTLSLEAVNQHVVGWDSSILSAPRNSEEFLLNVTKLALHDDLSINFMGIYGTPNAALLGILTATLKVNDSVTLGLNVVYPHTRDRRSALWNVRDQKQVGVKFTYQFQ